MCIASISLGNLPPIRVAWALVQSIELPGLGTDDFSNSSRWTLGVLEKYPSITFVKIENKVNMGF